MSGEPSPTTAVIERYAAYLQAKTHAVPETRMNGDEAELQVSVGDNVLVLVFHCHKQEWFLRSTEVRCGMQTATFSRGELVKAVEALLARKASRGVGQRGLPYSGTTVINTSPITAITSREGRLDAD